MRTSSSRRRFLQFPVFAAVLGGLRGRNAVSATGQISPVSTPPTSSGRCCDPDRSWFVWEFAAGQIGLGNRYCAREKLSWRLRLAQSIVRMHRGAHLIVDLTRDGLSNNDPFARVVHELVEEAQLAKRKVVFRLRNNDTQTTAYLRSLGYGYASKTPFIHGSLIPDQLVNQIGLV